jgi:hypothetical protein
MKEDFNRRDFGNYNLPGASVDVDLSPETCSPECWAFLNRPDSEKNITMEDWLGMYRERVANGQGSKKV